MKRFNELNEVELLALDDQQVSVLVDYECALEGVPMLPPEPGVKPVQPEIKKDVTVYSLQNTVMVKDITVLNQILKVLEGVQLYTQNYGNPHYTVTEIESNDAYNAPRIATNTYPTKEAVDAMKGEFAKFKAEDATYTEKKSEYDEALTKRNEIAEDVYEAIREARTKDYERQRIRSEFARYLELAEGNKRIALNFLEKASAILYKYPEMKEELCPCHAEPETIVNGERNYDRVGVQGGEA